VGSRDVSRQAVSKARAKRSAGTRRRIVPSRRRLALTPGGGKRTEVEPASFCHRGRRRRSPNALSRTMRRFRAVRPFLTEPLRAGTHASVWGFFFPAEPPVASLFPGPLTRLVSEYLHVTNRHPDQSVAFKVKTTAPKQYCVRPNSGKIKPGETVQIQDEREKHSLVRTPVATRGGRGARQDRRTKSPVRFPRGGGRRKGPQTTIPPVPPPPPLPPAATFIALLSDFWLPLFCPIFVDLGFGSQRGLAARRAENRPRAAQATGEGKVEGSADQVSHDATRGSGGAQKTSSTPQASGAFAGKVWAEGGFFSRRLLLLGCLNRASFGDLVLKGGRLEYCFPQDYANTQREEELRKHRDTPDHTYTPREEELLRKLRAAEAQIQLLSKQNVGPPTPLLCCFLKFRNKAVDPAEHIARQTPGAVADFSLGSCRR
ncbi:MAG: hypothetical protein BJ554DRAFT_3090, partial [Olpidium bornovanus]